MGIGPEESGPFFLVAPKDVCATAIPCRCAPGMTKCTSVHPCLSGELFFGLWLAYSDVMARKLRVGVLFGGRSGEHEVSLLSAASVLKAIDTSKYDVVPIGITKEGRWVTAGSAE